MVILLPVLPLFLAGCSEYQFSNKGDEGEGHTSVTIPAPDIVANPVALDFGSIATESSSALVVEVSNVGSATLELFGLFLTDSSGSYSTTGLGVTTLDPGELTNFVVTYSPDLPGVHEGRIDIYSDDPDTETLQVPIVGNTPSPVISVEPYSYDFGVVTEATDLIVRVENIGDATLEVEGVSYYSSSATELFLEDQGLFIDGTGQLEPGEGTDLIVRFDPTDSSAEEGNLHIFSNDLLNPEAIAVQMAEGPPCEADGWSGTFFAQAYDGSEIRLYPSNGDGTFGSYSTAGASLGESFASALVVADFDEDTSLDIVVKMRPDEATDYRLVRFYYDACEEDWLYEELMPSIDYSVVGGGDFNGDGWLDMFGYDTTTLTGRTLLGNGDGTFTEVGDAFDLSSVWTNYKLGATYQGADLNGDGYDDIVVFEYSSGGTATSGLYIYYSNGDGTFGDAILSTTLSVPVNGMDLADMDGDGLSDLVVGLDDDGDPGQAWLMLGDGKGLGEPVDLFDVNTAMEGGSDDCCSGHINVYDWNGDAVPDVLAGYYSGSWVDPKVDLFVGDGLGGVSLLGNVLPVGDATTIWMSVPIE